MATMPMFPPSPMSRSAPERQRLYMAAALALIAEAALLGGVWVALLDSHAVPPPERPPTMLSLASMPAPVAQPQPQPPRPVQPQPRPKPAVPVHRALRPEPQKPVEPPRKPDVTPPPAPTQPTPAAPTEPARPVPTPPAPAAPSAPSPNFEGKLRAAIEAALHYPESARMSGIAGRTRVAFEYRDGVVSAARVVVSSGVALLDRAALEAVRDANYPKPEAAFAGKTLTEQLWVNFNLDEQE